MNELKVLGTEKIGKLRHIKVGDFNVKYIISKSIASIN